MLPSLNPYAMYFKIAIVVLIVLMGMYIKMQSSEINTLTTKLETSEQTNKTLNETISAQNKTIVEANAKFETVQSQLTEANGLNKALASNVGKIKNELGKRPIAQTCPDAMKDLRDTAKKVGDVWSR